MEKNDHNILSLFSCESSDIFLRHFKESLDDLVRVQILPRDVDSCACRELPEDFLVNHISGSFVEMVQWWSKNGRRESPETLDRYFRAVLPVFVR